MATSSIFANFDLTKKSSAKKFVKALSTAHSRTKSKRQENVTLLTVQGALGLLRKQLSKSLEA